MGQQAGEIGIKNLMTGEIFYGPPDASIPEGYERIDTTSPAPISPASSTESWLRTGMRAGGAVVGGTAGTLFGGMAGGIGALPGGIVGGGRGAAGGEAATDLIEQKSRAVLDMLKSQLAAFGEGAVGQVAGLTAGAALAPVARGLGLAARALGQ